MKDLIKKILKKRFGINVIFSTLDYDCSKIYIFYDDLNFVDDVCNLLFALKIVVYNKSVSDDCCVIDCEILNKNKSEYVLNDK